MGELLRNARFGDKSPRNDERGELSLQDSMDCFVRFALSQ